MESSDQSGWSLRGTVAAGLSLVLALAVFSSEFVTVSAAEKDGERPTVARSVFGQMPDGAEVHLFTLANAAGLEARVMTYGATLVSVKAPDRDGNLDHITLHLDSLDDYVAGHPLFGSVVGRYANRIAGARFTIDGVEYRLTPNAGPNHIHGGRQGFHKIVFQAESLREEDRGGVRLSHTSPDGHEGYPGTLDTTVTYWLTNDSRLIISYDARTDRPTHLNLTNHAYWNLAGAGSGDVLGHELTLNADRYLPSDDRRMPLGNIEPVEGTPMDFTKPQTIGARVDRVPGQNYDHCYVLNKRPGGLLSLAARVVDPKTGRVMEVHTTQPGVQLYTAKGLSDRLGADGKSYGPYHAFCLETQHYPDSPNRPAFPSTLLRPGETYEEVSIYKFSVAD